ncbi:MAG: hypothetical protein HYX61_05380 [Gammaproteobacteria bacterium]|nr:hypothetical protein [Gammaproteobacteria bacterium]
MKASLPPTLLTKKENHSPNTPAIKILSAQKEEQTSHEELFESGYKEIAFQFQQVKITAPSGSRKLSLKSTQPPPASYFQSSENDGARINAKTI